MLVSVPDMISNVLRRALWSVILIRRYVGVIKMLTQSSPYLIIIKPVFPLRRIEPIYIEVLKKFPISVWVRLRLCKIRIRHCEIPSFVPSFRDQLVSKGAVMHWSCSKGHVRTI